jgi:hypothetical protein
MLTIVFVALVVFLLLAGRNPGRAPARQERAGQTKREQSG